MFVAEKPCKVFIRGEDRPPLIGPARGLVDCYLQGIEAECGFKFDPKVGAPASKRIESCMVGIVQNVLFETLSFEYDGERPSKGKAPPGSTRSWGEPEGKCVQVLKHKDNKGAMLRLCDGNAAVDSRDGGHQNAFPFYGEPTTAPQLTVPYRNVFYNESGFGTSVKAGEIEKLLPKEMVTHHDNPNFQAPSWSPKGAPLKQVTHIISFGIWLVVLDQFAQLLQTLAQSDDFSLLYTCKFAYNPELKRNGLRVVGSHTAKMKRGLAKTTSDFTLEEEVRFHPGGTSKPVLEGETVNLRDQRWITNNYWAL